MRTKKVAKFRELISGKVTEAFPSIEEYGKREILLTRMMAYKEQVFAWATRRLPEGEEGADRGHGAGQDDDLPRRRGDAGATFERS